MIELKKLKKIYKLEDLDVKALDGIDLKINAGEFVIILGQSGSGKSTLLNILGGMDKPTSGEVLVDDENIVKNKPSALAKFRREKVGIIFQKFNLITDMSVLENVMLPLKFSGFSQKVQKTRALKALDSVNLLDKINSVPSKLSGGQAQRVAIARALINEPEILLCDEPTGNLDSKTGKEIMDLLALLNKQGRTIIAVTHNEQYAVYASHIIKMLDGKIFDEKKPISVEEKKIPSNTTKNINIFASTNLALKNVNRRKFRVFLTSFGIAIGAMAILVLVSFGAGIQKEATGQMKAFGQTNEIMVSSSKTTGADFRGGGSGDRGNNSFVISEVTPLNDKVITEFKNISNVKNVFPSVSVNGQIMLGDKTGRLLLQSVPPLSEDQSAITKNLKYGKYFTSDNENSIIIPYGLAQALGYDKGQDIIGKEVTLKSMSNNTELNITVSGVFDEKKTDIFQSNMPNTTAADFQKKIKSSELLKANPAIYDQIAVISKDNAYVTAINNNLISKGFSTRNYADTAKTINRIFVMLQVAMGIVGGIAMLVASLGIINTMMMSILERTREIGIMKAIGAREKDIKSIFLIEAATIGFIGGMVGLLLGYPSSKLAAVIFNNLVLKNAGGQSITFVIAPYLAMGVLAFSILVAVFAGYFPARRGAGLDPVIALRDE